ncbi:hypothetical protein EG329_012906 [Mollisiaceae sp. DMI_Dod_QoI]|nr:hypothetical protein EG329_012906 [Helotiales sp. DMI_Dod_QoI]
MAAASEVHVNLPTLSRYTQCHLDLYKEDALSLVAAPAPAPAPTFSNGDDKSRRALQCVALLKQKSNHVLRRGKKALSIITLKMRFMAKNKKAAKTDTNLAGFPLFLDLPVEIQDEIWKHFIEGTSRTVYFARPQNPPIILRQINHELRAEYKLYGYMDINQIISEEVFTTIVHPSIDIIYFPEHHDPDAMVRGRLDLIMGLHLYNQQIMLSLTVSGALDRLRCIALTQLELFCFGEQLIKAKNLELIIVVLENLFDVRFNETGTQRYEWRPLDRLYLKAITMDLVPASAAALKACPVLFTHPEIQVFPSGDVTYVFEDSDKVQVRKRLVYVERKLKRWTIEDGQDL